MKFKFFAIPARYPEAAEAELNAFCSQHRISYIDKHLVANGADSFWSICISWLEGEAASSGFAANRSKPSVDYKQILTEADFAMYLELRNYRKELADQQNVPPYALFTNEQLAAMIRQRIRSKTELADIPGVGKSRIDKYGEVFLQKLKTLWAQSQSSQPHETDLD